MSQGVLATTDFDKLFVTCKSFAEKDLVGLVPGAKWRETQGHWELNLSWASCKQLRSIFGDALLLDATVIDWGSEELEHRIAPCMVLRDQLNPGLPYPPALDSKLYPYQVAGAQFLATAKQAILSDPPGSGKTATSVSAAKLVDGLPALVIAPKSTLVSWGREVERWWPGTPVYIIDGPREQRTELILAANGKPGIVVINWEAVWRHSRLSAYGAMRLSQEQRTEKELNQVPFRLIIADEAHRMQNPKSIQTRAVWYLGDAPSVQYRWALTGTPLTNQIDTIWSVLRFINKTEWPSRVAFIDRYAMTRVVPWGSGSEVIGLNQANEEEFQEIFQPRFRRMPKEIILPQLPPIQRTRRLLEMSPAQARSYRTMVADMIAETESGELLIASNPAVKNLRMVQFSSACVDLKVGEPDLDGNVRMVARLTDPSNKLDALMDDLPDLLAAGESVVVFAVSRQLIEMAEGRLTEAKIPYSVVKGDQTLALRQLEVDRFQDGHTKVVLVVVAAGGVGLTLTAGRIAIFLQRSWSYMENHQAECRIHRIGSEQHPAIQIIDYLSRSTVDEVVVQVSEGKEIKLEEIVRDREMVIKLLRGDYDLMESTG